MFVSKRGLNTLSPWQCQIKCLTKEFIEWKIEMLYILREADKLWILYVRNLIQIWHQPDFCLPSWLSYSRQMLLTPLWFRLNPLWGASDSTSSAWTQIWISHLCLQYEPALTNTEEEEEKKTPEFAKYNERTWQRYQWSAAILTL